MPPPPGKLVRVEAADFAKADACGCTCEGAPPGEGVVAAADVGAGASAGAGAGASVGAGLGVRAGAGLAACTSNEKSENGRTGTPSPSPSCYLIPAAESQLVCSFAINAQLFSSRRLQNHLHKRAKTKHQKQWG